MSFFGDFHRNGCLPSISPRSAHGRVAAVRSLICSPNTGHSHYQRALHQRKLKRNPYRLVVAGRLSSPTAALWQSGSKTPALADWPLSGNRYGSFGHPAAGQPENLNGSNPM